MSAGFWGAQAAPHANVAISPARRRGPRSCTIRSARSELLERGASDCLMREQRASCFDVSLRECRNAGIPHLSSRSGKDEAFGHRRSTQPCSPTARPMLPGWCSTSTPAVSGSCRENTEGRPGSVHRAASPAGARRLPRCQPHLWTRRAEGGSRATSAEVPYARKGFDSRIVSPRSAPTEMQTTGTPTSSSMRRTYRSAVAGRSSNVRAPDRLCSQPGSSS